MGRKNFIFRVRTFSAQLQHYERQPVQDQMAKVLRHHKKSGYITAVRYERTIDAESQPDWIMYLTPGPKAHAEFAAAHNRRKIRKVIDADSIQVGDHEPPRRRSGFARHQAERGAVPTQLTFDPQLIAAFREFGITEKKTHALLANLKPGQTGERVLAQLELG